MSQTYRWKGNWRNKWRISRVYGFAKMPLCSSQLQCWRIIPGRDASGKQSSLVVQGIWFVEGNVMTPFDGPCVAHRYKSASQRVRRIFSLKFLTSWGYKYYDNLPELGVLDLARRTNRGNQFHKQAHKTQMIAKTLWCFIDHHAFFPDTLWRRATERFRSSGKKKHNRWLFLIHRCGVSNYVWSQIRPDPPIC